MKDLLYVAMLLLAGVRPCGAQVAALVYDPKQDLNASLQIAEGVEVLANQLLELLPLDVVEIVSTISDDMTILNTIIQEGSQVGMDLQSLQVQITSLFDLSTAPATSSELMDLVFLFIEFYIAALM